MRMRTRPDCCRPNRSTTPKLPLGLLIRSGLPPAPDWTSAVEPPPSRLRPSKTPRSIIRAASSEVVTPTLYPGWRPSTAIKYKKRPSSESPTPVRGSSPNGSCGAPVGVVAEVSSPSVTI